MAWLGVCVCVRACLNVTVKQGVAVTVGSFIETCVTHTHTHLGGQEGGLGC